MSLNTIKKFLTTHFFDVLIGVVIILTISTLLWFRQSKKTKWIETTIQITNAEWWWPGVNPNQWYTADLHVGDQSFNTFGQPVAEVIGLDTVDVGEQRQKTIIRVKLEAKYDAQKQVYLFNFQPLQIGKPIELGFGKHNISGVVSAVNSGKTPTEYRTIEVKLIKIFPWEANALQKGMQNVGRDNEVLLEVLNVQSSPHTSRVFSDRRGEMIQTVNADYRDVTALLRLKSYQADSVWYYIDGSQLKIGTEIWLQFPTVTVKEAKIIRLVE